MRQNDLLTQYTPLRNIPIVLIGTNLISEFVDAVLHTGFLVGDSPQSAMLIASPESGKTSIVEDKQCRSVGFVSDMIGSGLLEELSEKSYLRHIIINDMIAIMAHKEVTNQRTFAVMSALTEEGLGKVMLPGGLSVDFGKRKLGFICCIPSELAKDNRRWWNKSGFMTRMIPFNYEYSEPLLIEIKKTMIVSGAYESRNHIPKFAMPVKKFNVEIGEAFAKQVQVIADQVAEKMDEKGIRRGKQFRALVRGHALTQKRTEVIAADLEFLKRIAPHINYALGKELPYQKEKPVEVKSQQKPHVKKH
jgi:hypothetical protein